jgi:hypothetical protein
MLETLPLCRVDIELAPEAPIALGRSPWRNRRISAITGGTFQGDRLRGEVLAAGGDWSELGVEDNGDALTLLNVRSLWRAESGALIHVTYQGRLVIPAEVLAAFRDPQAVLGLPEGAYYFRMAATFETSDADYGWLNRIVAVGIGRRSPAGVTYEIHELA